MKLLVDVFDQNWKLRVIYPVAGPDEAVSGVEYARHCLQKAVQDGHVHKDEEKFCRMRLRSAGEDG